MTSATFDAATLTAAAAWVARVCPAKPTTPILGGMLVDVDDTEVRLTAYDYDTAATHTIPIIVGDPGRILVSGRLLSAVAAAVAKAAGKTPDVTIRDTGTTVTVTTGRSEWALPALPVEDYPQLPGITAPRCEVSADELRHALARVMPAVDRKGQLPALGTVEVSSTGDTLTLAATDRFRLAATTIPWKPHDQDDLASVLVPFELLEAATKALTGSGTVRIGTDGASFTVATDAHTLTGRTVDAAFPQWRRLMPTPQTQRVAVVAAADLRRAADQAAVMLEGVQSLRLDFTPDTVTVSVAGEGRSATSRADVAHYAGDPVTVAVNAGYLRDALTAATTELVEIQFGENPSRPLLLLPVVHGDAPADEYRHLLMPVKL
ncbi:MAG: DNA polymerase III subunit beta [Vicinamibacterales bacterium]